MYIPHYFKIDNADEIKGFLQLNSFGILISHSDDKLLATHIPLELHSNSEGRNVLWGHISKGNVQSKHFETGAEVLAIFTGPHTYISSSWYNHENVPTWNYIAVHVYGKIKIIEGEPLKKALKELVNKYELQSKNPISIEDMSPEFLKKEMRGIVGFEIEITEIQGAFKLSQNRDDVNYYSIIQELEKRGDSISLEIANKMRKIRG